MNVQVFGLQRSGNNYLHWLIRENLPLVPTRRGGWRHALPSERFIDHRRNEMDVTVVENLDRLGIHPVVIRKDFDHWLESLHRAYPDGFWRGDPVAAYDQFYSEWSFAPTVRYESFLFEFKGSLRYLGSLFNVEPVSYAEPITVDRSPNWKSSHRGRYLEV